MAESKQRAFKFTLPNKKVVTLGDIKIHHTRTASQVAGAKAGNNTMHFQVLMQEEMVKLLIIAVDEKVLSATEKENLDNLFTVAEFSQVIKCVEMIGGGMEGEPVMAIATS